MKRGFILLETLLALWIFSVVLIASSKLYSELVRDRFVLEALSDEYAQVQRTLLIVQNYLLTSCCVTFLKSGIIFYPLDTQAYYHPNFSLSPLAPFSNHTQFWLSLPSFTLLYSNPPSFLEGEVLLPLKEKTQIVFKKGALWLNETLLLEHVREFSLQEKIEQIEGELCLRKCYRFGLFKGGIYEEI